MSLIYKLISIIIIIAVSVFAIALAMVNTEAVNFNYYLDKIEIPLSLLLVFSFITGVLISYLILLPTLVKLKIQSMKQKVAINKATNAQLKLVNPDNQL